MSKSGSKALSKSVDSVVKSVESVVSSVVPKNMNMKHVLLAILVGLLLCMLFSNTVEGLECNLTDSNPPTGYKAGGSALSASQAITLGSGSGAVTDMTGSTVSPVITCDDGYDGNPTASCDPSNGIATLAGCAATGAGGAPCDVNTGPFNTTSGDECAAWCSDGTAVTEWGSGETTGVCLSSNPAPLVKNACLKLVSEPLCNADNANSCTWKDLDSYVAERGPHTDEYYNPLLRAGGILRPGCKSNYRTGDINDLLLRSQQTKKLQLFTGGLGATGARGLTGAADFATMPADDKSKWNGIKTTTDSNYYDFIRLVAGSTVDTPAGSDKPKVSDVLNSSTVGGKIPTPIKSLLLPLVIRAEDLWKETDPDGIVLKLNGGRVIFGYNDKDGFVLRNPPTKQQNIPLPTRNFHIGFPCAGTWDNVNNKIDSNADKVSCNLDAACMAKGKDLDFETMAGAAIGGGICELPRCKDLDICAVSRAQSVVGKNITEAINTITTALT